MDETDRISELPDDILQRILSPLPVEDKVRTSVLSKRWLHLWPSNPTLDFGDCTVYFFCDDAIAAAIDRCLYPCTVSLKVLDLCVDIDDSDCSSISHLDKWIRRADERFLPKLILCFGGGSHFSFKGELPASLFRCQWLSWLELEGCRFCLPPRELPNFCSRLRTLYLQNVYITSDTLSTLLSASIFLENLVLISLWGLTQLEITNQNQQLKLLLVFDPQLTCHLLIADAPSLQSLTYAGNLLNLSFLKKPPKLTQVGFMSRSARTLFQLDWRELLLNVRHIEMLSLYDPFLCIGMKNVGNEMEHCSVIELYSWDLLHTYLLMMQAIPEEFSIYVPSMITRMDGLLVCKSLKELHICSYPLEQASLYAILYSLQYITSLEKLCLSLETYEEYYHGHQRAERRLTPPYLNLQYNMSHIKTITMIGLTGDWHEIQVVKFMLRKAVSLDSLIMHPKEGKQITEKLQKALLRFPKASKTAQIIFSEALEDDVCPRQFGICQDSLSFN